MLLNIEPNNPDLNKITKAVEYLKQGCVIIYPTDTIYTFGCDLNSEKAIEKINKIRGKNGNTHFSLVCHDFSQIADYTLPFSTSVFRLMKKSLPGPFTFILPANKQVARIFDFNKTTIGIRVPDNNIARELVKQLGNPIASASVHNEEDELLEYITEPREIYEKYNREIDMMIDGGIGNNEASTVVDVSNGEPVIIRQGKGVLIA